MLMQESAYKISAKNIRCGISIETGQKDCIIDDYGIGQINHKTIKAFNFDQQKLLTDLTYSVEASAKVLADFKRIYYKSEPDTWWSRYNCGTRGLDRIGPICQKYVKLVSRHM